jgi:hypothetical protein
VTSSESVEIQVVGGSPYNLSSPNWSHERIEAIETAVQRAWTSSRIGLLHRLDRSLTFAWGCSSLP